jgi:hypothetical protein
MDLTPEQKTLLIFKLLSLLQNPTSYIRQTAIKFFGKISCTLEQQTQLFLTLLPLLRDIDYDVRFAAIKVLHNITHTPEQTAQLFFELLVLLQDSNYILQWAAVIETLGKMALAPEQVTQLFPSLLFLLGDSNYSIQKYAIKILEKIISTPEQQEQFFLALFPLLRNPDRDIQQTAINGLSKMTLTQEQQVQLLHNSPFSSQPQPTTKLFSEVTLTPIQPAKAFSYNLSCLQDSNYITQSDALWSLSKMTLTPEQRYQALPLLVDCYSKLASRHHRCCDFCPTKLPTLHIYLSALGTDNTNDKKFIIALYKVAVRENLPLWVSANIVYISEKGEIHSHLCTEQQMQFFREAQQEVLGELKMPMPLQLPSSSSAGTSSAGLFGNTKLQYRLENIGPEESNSERFHYVM